MLHYAEQVMHGIEVFQLGHDYAFKVGFGVFHHKLRYYDDYFFQKYNKIYFCENINI